MNHAYNTILAINSRINDNSDESNALQEAANSITFGTASEDDDYITCKSLFMLRCNKLKGYIIIIFGGSAKSNTVSYFL